ncbi:sensor histidine kinase [Flavilitoribacter nigricans]|nr:histidine kinase [Flavilitoribacter nigricans]
MAQIGGWSLATFLNIVINQLLQPYPGLVMASILAMSLGCLTTLLYRKLIHRWGWRNRSPRGLVIPVLFSVPVISTLWAVSFALAASLFGAWLGIPRAPFLQYFLGVFVSGQMIILIWVSSYFAYHYFTKFSQAEVEKWRLKAIAKEAQLGALKAQINPHFMFNALNNIRALILEDQSRSREMLTHLSELLRYNFSSNNQQLVPLDREMDIVRSYLELVSIQYEKRLFAQIDYDRTLSEVLVPPMVIQLLVENAIKHGVALSPDGGKVMIYAERVGQLIRLVVKNTGYLQAQERLEAPSGVGLQNIRERLRLLFDDKADFRIEERNGWVTASVLFPIEEMI